MSIIIKSFVKKLCNIAPFLCALVGSIYVACGHEPLLITPVDSSFHFSLITVNALFGGFLYTNYSLLIGLLDNSIVDKLKNTDIITKRNAHILKGIIYATISVVAGLFLVLVPPQESKILTLVYSFAQNAEIAFMAFLILYFLLSLKEMCELIGTIHRNDAAKSPKEMNDLKTKVKNSNKN